MTSPCGKAESCEKCPFPDCEWDGVTQQEAEASDCRDEESAAITHSPRYAQKKAYYEAHRDAARAYQREYQAKNRQRLSDNARDYYRANRDRINARRRELRKQRRTKEGDDDLSYFTATVKSHGFKLGDFAEQIGLTGATLSSRIHGHTPWTLPEAQRACKVLGMTLDTFAGYFPLQEG